MKVLPAPLLAALILVGPAGESPPGAASTSPSPARNTEPGYPGKGVVRQDPLEPERGVFDERITAAIARHREQIIGLRHDIHEHPELGNREYRTSALVADHLQSLGLEVTTGIAHTGVVALLTGGRPGPLVAVRADMDALPVTEATDLPFRSRVRTEYSGREVGVMHACGHDVHTAIGLGTATVLAELKAELPGRILFIFQPAEEGAPAGEEGGASLMVAEGVLDDPRPAAIFGLHTDTIPVGQVTWTPGPAMAAVDHFTIRIRGTQTHGAMPHQGIDPIVTAAQLILALQTIPSRTLDPVQPCVVTVGSIHGGERFNIIPDTVLLDGTVRTYDADVRDTVERRMNEIVANITAAAGAEGELHYGRGSPPLINDLLLTRLMIPTLEAVLGESSARERPPSMGGEDFAVFAGEVPGFFFWLGVVKEGTVSGPHHSPTFRADDSAIPVGIRAMSNLVADFLSLHEDPFQGG